MQQILWLAGRDIAGAGMGFEPVDRKISEEVQCVRPRSLGVELYGSDRAKPGRIESE
jgi:hypothetical protein